MTHPPPLHPDPSTASAIRYDARRWTDALRCELSWQDGRGPTVLLVGEDGSRHRYTLTPDMAHRWAARLVQLLGELHRQKDAT